MRCCRRMRRRIAKGWTGLIEKGFEEMDVEQQDTVLSKLAAKKGSGSGEADARWF